MIVKSIHKLHQKQLDVVYFTGNQQKQLDVVYFTVNQRKQLDVVYFTVNLGQTWYLSYWLIVLSSVNMHQVGYNKHYIPAIH